MSLFEFSNIFQFKNERNSAKNIYNSSSKSSLNLFSSDSNDSFEPNSKPICSPLIINTMTNNNHQSNENLNSLNNVTSLNIMKIGGMDSGYASTVDENRFSREVKKIFDLFKLNYFNFSILFIIHLKKLTKQIYQIIKTLNLKMIFKTQVLSII